MNSCKYCRKSFEAPLTGYGKPSRAAVCTDCKPKSRQIQAEKLSATLAERRDQTRSACKRCLCPLTLLRTSTGKEEGRRLCVRCKERRVAERGHSEQKAQSVKRWVDQNRERVREHIRAWKAANKDRISASRKKLLIEDVLLVREAMSTYYSRRPPKKPKVAIER